MTGAAVICMAKVPRYKWRLCSLGACAVHGGFTCAALNLCVPMHIREERVLKLKAAKS